MAKVEFKYNNTITIIQCNENSIMKDICKSFASKVSVEIDTIYFIYSSSKLNKELTFSQCANQYDKQRKKMSVLVYEIDENDTNIEENFVKSKEIICPTCGGNSQLKIKNYKMSLFNCKLKHNTNNLTLDKFNNSQLVDESTIICDKCKVNNKFSTYNHIFYICNSCNLNLCPLCRKSHLKIHQNIIKYDQKNYICKSHNEIYNSFCEQCKVDLCVFCEGEHENHNVVYYGKIMPKINDIKSNLNNLKEVIGKFKIEIENIIKIIKEMNYNLDKYYQICSDIINNNIEVKNRNYSTLYNIKIINNSNFNTIKDLETIINENDISEKFKKIMKLKNQMESLNNSKEGNNEITIVYNINKEENKIKIFGSNFVKNNINNCKILYQNKEYELKEYFEAFSKKDSMLQIKLRGINNIIDASYMFYECTSLIYLPDIDKWDTDFITSMRCMFFGCSSIVSLPGISKFNMEYLENMSWMFSGCTSLANLPDISNWQIPNVYSLNGLFYKCESLVSLPDISKWDTKNVSSMSCMFYGCSKLICFPDISKWNISNVKDINELFYECTSLISLPDISKWDTSNIINMDGMFYGCSSLSELPNLSLLNIKNVKSKDWMFYGCKEGLNIPKQFLSL